MIKDCKLSTEQKCPIGSKEDKMRCGVSRRVGASVAATEEDPLDCVHQYYNSCNIVDSKICPFIWKVEGMV